MTAVILGIDPGKEGAVAALALDGTPLWARPLPYADGDAQPLTRTLRAGIYDALPGARVLACGVELVNSFGMGRQSAFVFGQGVGALLALAELEGWAAIRVRPQAWQRTIGATGKGKAVDPLGPVSRLFPSFELRSSVRCSKPHSGIVDALGIAEHVRRIAGVVPAASPFG